MGRPLYPSLYQINTRAALRDLSAESGRPATLDDFPDARLDQVAALGFDWVWFLGVWQTGPAGCQVSLAQPDWRHEYRNTLPDLTDDDVVGSPFAIRSYTVHQDFGGPAALARLRERLKARGLRLMLDFVPNHVALDHPWVEGHPEYLVPGSAEDLAREPQNYTRRGSRILAHGRDPYFPGWPDTLQLNYRHPGLREAMRGELARVGAQCDGVRCDMAMLILPGVFQRTWGDRARPADGATPDDTPFWPEATARIHRDRPDFLFMAEVYWDLEWELQQQGFGATYDKRLYDRLHGRDTAGVRGHLLADPEFQRKSVRFLENHDEPRAAGAFPPDVHRAAAVATFFVPGLRFFHEGQLEGRRVKLSMHLGRRPEEPRDEALHAFYRRLLDCLKRPEVRDGSWRLLDVRPAWDGNPTHDRFLAYSWEAQSRRLLVVSHYGPTQGQCYVPLPFADLAGRRILLRDLLGPFEYHRGGDDLRHRGLYLDLPAWGYHAFELLG